MSKNHNFKDLSNQQFGYLTALSIDETKTTPGHHTYWYCKCVCGKTRSLQTYQLTSGRVTSCGCQNKGRRPSDYISDKKRLYSIYGGMIARCCNPKNISYKYYGLKGIQVCDEWKNDFKAFAEWSYANGYNDTLSIDRIDNSKGYTPDNCRWVTWKEQCLNKSTSVTYTHNGKTLNMLEWCKELNFPYGLAKSRRKQAKQYGIEPTFEYVFAPRKQAPHKHNLDLN